MFFDKISWVSYCSLEFSVVLLFSIVDGHIDFVNVVVFGRVEFDLFGVWRMAIVMVHLASDSGIARLKLEHKRQSIWQTQRQDLLIVQFRQELAHAAQHVLMSHEEHLGAALHAFQSWQNLLVPVGLDAFAHKLETLAARHHSVVLERHV